jgi:phage virion morphogenesis protein
MSEKPIEIEIDSKEVQEKLLELANRGENLRPLMKNIAGIFAYATEENFKNEGRPEKWVDLSESTKRQRQKKGKWPGQILQVTTQLALSVNTFYDDDSAVIGSNLAYAAIHQLGGQAGKNKKTTIPARPYLKLTEENLKEILFSAEQFLNRS